MIMFIKRLIITLGWLSILIGIGMIITVFYWETYPYVPITFHDKVFPISKKIVYQGDEISYTSRYCKYMNISNNLTREFRNNLIFVTPTTINNRPVGCHTINIAVTIPLELPPGIYHMHQLFEYHVNPLRDIKLEMDTEKFEVKEATHSAFW